MERGEFYSVAIRSINPNVSPGVRDDILYRVYECLEREGATADLTETGVRIYTKLINVVLEVEGSRNPDHSGHLI